MSPSLDNSNDKYSGPICQQRKINGDPCTSRALPGEPFCHNHKVMGPAPINIHNGDTFPAVHLYLPRLNNAISIQNAISEVCELMLHRRIEPKEASALFYAMQVASFNLAPLRASLDNNKLKPNPDVADPNSSSTVPPPGTIQACAEPRRKRSAK
ncbi:MAG TPA: hypothetical protein VKR59_03995 [Terriglobales bacterium]|nr:hypothetical protein [Terriglobales bacterium]